MYIYFLITLKAVLYIQNSNVYIYDVMQYHIKNKTKYLISKVYKKVNLQK